VRDGSMSNSHMALAGNPRMLSIWAPFLLANPSVVKTDTGQTVREFLQIVGSRWTKSEHDGLYYTLLSLYCLHQTTGDDSLLDEAGMTLLVELIERAISARLDSKSGLFFSDTRGESTLASSPYYGYDTVNGELDKWMVGVKASERPLLKCATLYHNVNMYNVLRMGDALVRACPAVRAKTGDRYANLAGSLAESITEHFRGDDGVFKSEIQVFADGEKRLVGFADGDGDYWEYAWAVSTGPFFPDLPAAIKSARLVTETWPKIRDYGYCPWNTLSRLLKEYGMSTDEYKRMHADQVAEALMLTRKYPMAGLLTEYRKNVEGWRGLPFSTGSFVLSAVSLMLQPLVMGLAVRASDLAEKLENFVWRTSRITAAASGSGDFVAGASVNGAELQGTLQIPESLLRLGPNRIEIKRSGGFDGFRLYGSSAALHEVRAAASRIEYLMSSPSDAQLVFEGYDKAKSVKITSPAGKDLDFTPQSLPDSRLTLVCVPSSGDFRVKVSIT